MLKRGVRKDTYMTIRQNYTTYEAEIVMDRHPANVLEKEVVKFEK